MAFIKYVVKAAMMPSQNSKLLPMLHKQSLIIREQHNQSHWNKQETSEVNIKQMLLLSKGVSRLSCNFEKDVYSPDEVCRILCDIDNSRCSLNMTSIIVRLEQMLDVRGEGQMPY